MSQMRPVSCRLNGSSFHEQTGSCEGLIAESAVVMWHRTDMSLGRPQGSLSGIGNQLTVAGKVIRRQARQCTEGETRQLVLEPFFGNPAKSGSSQISSRIWQLIVQLQYVYLITDKTNTADWSSGVFTILIRYPGQKMQFFAAPEIS